MLARGGHEGLGNRIRRRSGGRRGRPGVRSIGPWVEAHPANGQRLAVAAITWTPSGMAAARRVQDTMRGAKRSGGRPGAAGAGRREGDGEILEA